VVGNPKGPAPHHKLDCGGSRDLSGAAKVNSVQKTFDCMMIVVAAPRPRRSFGICSRCLRALRRTRREGYVHLPPGQARWRTSPKLMQAYRDEELNLDQLTAFAITDDHCSASCHGDPRAFREESRGRVSCVAHT
jgi:hypothetical protein